MSTSVAEPEQQSVAAASARRQRALACVQCSSRKIKCDRQFPCTNCVKTNVQCVPATPGPRQRRRRFPGRELLDRVRRYESLLHQNNIKFEPLHTADRGKGSPATEGQGQGSDSIGHVRSELPAIEVTSKTSRQNSTIKAGTLSEAKFSFPLAPIPTDD